MIKLKMVAWVEVGAVCNRQTTEKDNKGVRDCERKRERGLRERERERGREIERRMRSE